MIIILVIDIFISALGIFAILRNYANDTISELVYQMICAKKDQKYAECMKKYDLAEIYSKQAEELKKKTLKFRNKWKFFLSFNTFGLFDSSILEEDPDNFDKWYYFCHLVNPKDTMQLGNYLGTEKDIKGVIKIIKSLISLKNKNL